MSKKYLTGIVLFVFLVSYSAFYCYVNAQESQKSGGDQSPNIKTDDGNVTIIYESGKKAFKPINKSSEGYVMGLLGQYWNLPPFKDTPGDFGNEPDYVRIDNTFDFYWEGVPIKDEIQADYFGIQWTGEILAPKNGTYNFSIKHNEGARLTINGKVVNGWRQACYTCYYESDKDDGDIALKSNNWYPIRIELFKGKGKKAYFRLSWRIPGKSEFEVVSSEYLRTKPLHSK